MLELVGLVALSIICVATIIAFSAEAILAIVMMGGGIACASIAIDHGPPEEFPVYSEYIPCADNIPGKPFKFCKRRPTAIQLPPGEQ